MPSILTDYPSHPHICQSPEWGEFKSLVGNRAVRIGGVQYTLHPLPVFPFNIGYSPRVQAEKIDWEELSLAGKETRCIFIKLDVPNSPQDLNRIARVAKSGVTLKRAKPVFANETILLDLAPSEEELLTAMRPKTRYNINLAWKRGVLVEERDDEKSLGEFLRLQRETATRQGFYIHSDNYYRTLWKVLAPRKMAHLLVARLPTGETIASWMLFRYGDVLYYPYGGSDYRYRSFMASSLLMWEAIRLGKSLGCTIFDQWGAVSDPNDSWWGFSHFKLSFGGELVKLPQTYDLVVEPLLYPLIILANRLRWVWLRLRARPRERD